MRTAAETKVRSRIRRCKSRLRDRSLPKVARWQITKNLYYWFGWLDAMTGEKP